MTTHTASGVGRGMAGTCVAGLVGGRTRHAARRRPRYRPLGRRLGPRIPTSRLVLLAAAAWVLLIVRG